MFVRLLPVSWFTPVLLLFFSLKVVSAFHVGRGGTAMSYMGKGVTKNATLCLQHLTNEMASRALDQVRILDETEVKGQIKVSWKHLISFYLFWIDMYLFHCMTHQRWDLFTGGIPLLIRLDWESFGFTTSNDWIRQVSWTGIATLYTGPMD